jgi:hypothetical protein
VVDRLVAIPFLGFHPLSHFPTILTYSRPVPMPSSLHIQSLNPPECLQWHLTIFVIPSQAFGVDVEGYEAEIVLSVQEISTFSTPQRASGRFGA